jgi:hypothetical protein
MKKVKYVSMQLFVIMLMLNSKLFNKLNDGYDGRFPLVEPIRNVDEIYLNFKKKEVLDKLIQKDISLNEKIKIWENYKNNYIEDNFVPNIESEGLLDDWDFDLSLFNVSKLT